ncbi:DHA2 family efflux MFS transporter permease subunit [Spongisporangium articulatum]|uniref:DHA2 family efflux MFS transporter permease subunit n=1 Tax=Spongisporangium articulatum TaxID=3362603 RepID=A0ABW8ALR7_9ACTN
MRTWHGNPWAILLTLSLGFFMTLLDLTIVNIAIPSMIEGLDASLDEVLWVINSYVLVLAVLLITAGRLGDLRGQRTLFAAGVALFTLASLACGLAPNAALLIAFRALQGLGAALLMPQTMAIIVATFPAERRGTAMGVWGSVAGLATVAGPTLGGLLVTVADWRWIFFINVPIGALVLFLTFTLIPDTRLERRHKLDLTGVALSTASLFCLTFALIEGERFSWDGRIWGLVAGFAVLLVAFLVQQGRRQQTEPLVPFALFRDRNFASLSAVGALVSVGIMGFFLPLTIYLQSVLGFSALEAGLVLAPMSLVSVVVAPFAGQLSDRLSGKYILMAGLSVFAVGGAWLVAAAGVDTHWPVFMAPAVVMGIGMGGIFAPMATEAMRGVPPQLAGAAAGLNNTIRQVGSVIGSAAVGALLQAQLVSHLHEQAVARAAALPPAVRGRFVQGFADAASSGLEVGGGQAGASSQGLPAGVAQQVQAVAGEVFRHGFVEAQRPTMVLPIAALFVGAAVCLVVRRHVGAKAPGAGPQADPAADAVRAGSQAA